MWFPLQKAEEEVQHGERRRVLYSLISAEVPDGVHDTVRQSGMDCEPLLKEGYVNWDHMDGPENLIGEPISVSPTTLQDSIPATEARIWLYTGHPRADATWTLAQAQHDPDSRRRLGTSVQGQVMERQAHDILKSLIRHLAVSHQPLMPLSFVAIEKSLRLRAPLVRAQMASPDNPLNTLNLDVGLYGQCRRGHKCYGDDYVFKSGARGAMEHLVRCRGMSPEIAKAVLVGLHKSLSPRI